MKTEGIEDCPTLDLSLTDVIIPETTPRRPPTQTITPNLKVTPSSEMGDT